MATEERKGSLAVYLYEAITDETAMTLIKELRAKEFTSLSIAQDYNIDTPPIELYIHSLGGSLIAAFAIVGAIQNLKVPIYSYIEGGAASAATLVSVVCTRRFIYKHSRMLIHQLSSMMMGSYHNIKDETDNCDNFMEAIKDVYLSHTHIKKRDLSKYLSHDLWWDAEKCLALGLVDEVL